jgi:hypothetical protein
MLLSQKVLLLTTEFKM